MQAKALSAPVLPIIVLGLLFGGCGGGGSTATTTETETEASGAPQETSAQETSGNAPASSGQAVRAEKVEIVNFAYEPDPVTIQEGGKVTWLNQDSAPHTATADDGSFDTGTLEEGKLKSETFKEPGTYAYHCTIHPSMHGTVEVVESD